MFKVGFFYKKHTILDDWISDGHGNVIIPSGLDYVNLYFDSENQLYAVKSDGTEFLLIGDSILQEVSADPSLNVTVPTAADGVSLYSAPSNNNILNAVNSTDSEFTLIPSGQLINN